jgi:parvulin-like peptidyl-prolyl isomerase
VTRRFLLATLVLLAFVGTACGRYLTSGVAVVNGVSIGRTDLDQQLKVLRKSQQNAALFDPNNTEQLQEAERQIIATLVQQELVGQEARRLGAGVTEAQVNERLVQYKSQFQTEPAFVSALGETGYTLVYFRLQVRRQLEGEHLRDKVVGKPAATQAEIKALYGDGKAFEEIRIRHILFAVSGTDAAAAKREADAALAKLKAGADFAALAKKESDDPGSKAKGGDLGWATRETQFDPTFLAAAFALKKGQLSGVVQTQFGFHIIRVDDRRTKTLQQVRSQLAQQISQQKGQQLFIDYFKKAVMKADIVVNPRWGDFDPETLQITPRQFFVPPTPEPETVPFQIP